MVIADVHGFLERRLQHEFYGVLLSDLCLIDPARHDLEIVHDLP